MRTNVRLWYYISFMPGIKQVIARSTADFFFLNFRKHRMKYWIAKLWTTENEMCVLILSVDICICMYMLEHISQFNVTLVYIVKVSQQYKIPAPVTQRKWDVSNTDFVFTSTKFKVYLSYRYSISQWLDCIINSAVDSYWNKKFYAKINLQRANTFIRKQNVRVAIWWESVAFSMNL